MKRIISFISIFVLITNLFAFPISVKADGVPVPGYTELKEMQQDIENGDNRTIQDIWHVLQPIGNAIGIVMNPIQTVEFIRDMVDPVAQTLPDYPTNGSDTDKANYLSNYIVSNTTTNDSNKTYSLNQNAKNLVNGVVNNFITNSGYTYVYSLNTQYNVNNFPSGDLYNALRQKLNDIQGGKYCGLSYSFINDKYYLTCWDISKLGFVYNTNGNGGRTGLYECILYDLKTWVRIDGANRSNYMTQFEYNSNSKTFINSNTILTTSDWNYIWLSSTNNKSGFTYFTSTEPIGWNSDGVHMFKMYKTLQDLKSESVGVSSYYINNAVYNNYKNTSGDYTVSLDNSNHATYGDIQTYIDDHHNENETYPTPTQIEIYIEQVPAPTPTPTPTPTTTPTPVPTTTPDNPSGGTVSGNTANGGSASASATANNSGVNVTVNNNHNINLNIPGLSGNGIGSGTVSGNGNESGGIFDWISDIGGVIGDFIKNVGQLIADVIKGITETITTVLADIPNIISVLVEFVYGGLPDELKAIVTLGITTVIFVGVIKMMRK